MNKNLRTMFNLKITITMVIVSDNPGTVSNFKITITIVIISDNPIAIF